MIHRYKYKEIAEITERKWIIILLSFVLAFILMILSSTYKNISNYMYINDIKNDYSYRTRVLTSRGIYGNIYKKSKIISEGIVHKRLKRWLNKQPAIINVLIIDSNNSNIQIMPSYGSYFINSLKKVKDIVNFENAIAGINASYFKPDIGTPIGTSIIDNKIITGPLFKRVSFGITKENEFKMDKIDISGEIKIGESISLSLFNINQPLFSSKRFNIYTDKWGKQTPKTSTGYVHVVIDNNKVNIIKRSSVNIPKDGYVIVGPHSYLPKSITTGDNVSYTTKLSPEDWQDVRFAIGGGPYLVKNGEIFIDKQKFSKSFLWTKLPRTAIGYTKSGNLILLTIDGRLKGISEGATLSELAKIMYDFGVYNAMNLDGGTSTQMVINGKVVNYPAAKGGFPVTNALIVKKFF